MRTHAKAPSAGSSTGRGSRLAVCCLAVVAALAPASASAKLPSGWGYELVSPADSLGADIDDAAGSVDGEHAWVRTLLPISEQVGTGNFGALAFNRASSGWTVRGLADPNAPNNHSLEPVARSIDSSRVIAQRCPMTLISCTGEPLYWERVDADGTRTLMLQAPYTFGQPGPLAVGVADDLTSMFVSNHASLPPLLPEDTHTQGRGIYVSRDGALEFLGYDENGAVLDCGAQLAKGAGGTGFQQNGISADGETVAFESPDRDAGCPDPVDVYVRRNGQSVNASAPRPGDPDFGGANPNEGADYVGSNRRGDVAYFITETKLAAGDTDALADLYRYDLDTDSVVRVAPGADVAMAAVSPNGAYVYFRSPSAIDGEGTNGKPNLYLAHAGTITHIATADSGDFFLGGHMNSPDLSPITPDGTHLVFPADAELTGQPTGGFSQLFRYDATADTLTCVSCPPDGSTPTERSDFPATGMAASVDHRFQSDDGDTVVFRTRASLLPQEDINGALRDVYMWQDDGTPDGLLSLITTGHSQNDSELTSTDAAGDNVFFLDFERLIPGLENDNRKLYVARLGGGFPFDPPPLPCEGDACQGASVSAPATGALGSTGFFGRQSPAARRSKARKCATGKRKVRRNGKTRCVRKGSKKNRADADRRASR